MESFQSLRVVRDRIRDIIPFSIDHPCGRIPILLGECITELMNSVESDLEQKIITLQMDPIPKLWLERENIFFDKGKCLLWRKRVERYI